jgi:hypothetical protein
MMAEWRVEVLWRLDADSLDNDAFASIAETAEEKHDWLVSRWEDGVGFYVTGYVEAEVAAEAVVMLCEQSGAWMKDMSLSGHLAGVEALALDIAEIRAEKPTVPELASAADAAKLLGISRQRVHQLTTSNPRFPQPVSRVATGPLWTKASIEWFNSIWDRQPGRPAKSRQANGMPAARSDVTPIRAARSFGRPMPTKGSGSITQHRSIAARRSK